MPKERCVKLIPFFMQYKKQLLIGGVILGAILFYFFNQSSTKQPTTPLDPIEQLATNTPQEPPKSIEQQSDERIALETTIAVDVKGAVKKPGVYTMESDDRVYDAIMAAGGYKDTANSKTINHAAHVQDEMVIYVPKRGEKVDEVGATNTVAAPSQQETEQSLVNLNTADEAALQTISGIGPAKAKTIIQHRTDNGPFQSIDDLKNVSGFGEKTVERLRPLVTVQ